MYVDSRFRTNDSDSSCGFKFELMEALGLTGNTVCYVDDISIPHTWRTIESYSKRSYITLKTEVTNENTAGTYNWLPIIGYLINDSTTGTL